MKKRSQVGLIRMRVLGVEPKHENKVLACVYFNSVFDSCSEPFWDWGTPASLGCVTTGFFILRCLDLGCGVWALQSWTDVIMFGAAANTRI